MAIGGETEMCGKFNTLFTQRGPAREQGLRRSAMTVVLALALGIAAFVVMDAADPARADALRPQATCPSGYSGPSAAGECTRVQLIYTEVPRIVTPSPTDGPTAYSCPDEAVTTGIGAGIACYRVSVDISIIPAIAATAVAECGGQAVTVQLALGEKPTNGNDVIAGTSGDDVIDGRGGNDVICGLGGSDLLIGGSGNDRIYGGPGSNRIYGLKGNDTLFGGGGDDIIRGGSGNDFVRALGGDDDLDGGFGNDILVLGVGRDTAVGGQGDDTMYGISGPNRMYGGAGDDVLWGGPGSDRLMGQSGDDRLYGSDGRDALIGGDGSDYCFGGNDGDLVDCR